MGAPVDSEIREKYLKAGRIVADTLNQARSLIKPGSKLIDVCSFVEDSIRTQGAVPSFPLNIGVNEDAAHYTSPPDDKRVIPRECVVKLDCGATIEGYPTDMAISIPVGTDKYQYLIEAAEAGLEKAISMIKPGVNVRDVGKAVEQEITSFGAKVISNLMGHQMKQYNLHAGNEVPNIKTKAVKSYTFKEGDIFALEPFATDGGGYVKNGSDIYIHSLVKKTPKNLPQSLTREVNKIWKERRKLPFSLRWYHRITPVDFKRLKSRGVIRGYPILVEGKGGTVAQAEHTILVTSTGCEVITTQ